MPYTSQLNKYGNFLFHFICIQTIRYIISLSHSPEGVASSIDKEFRRMEKFVAFAGRGLTSSWSGRRIVVTPSWILFSHRTTFLPICQLLGHLSAVVVRTRSINNQIASLEEEEEQEQADPTLGSGVVMATIRIADMDSGACVLSFE